MVKLKDIMEKLRETGAKTVTINPADAQKIIAKLAHMPRLHLTPSEASIEFRRDESILEGTFKVA